MLPPPRSLTAPLCAGAVWSSVLLSGQVALELAARHPSVPCGVLLIDSVVCPPPELLAAVAPLGAALLTPDYVAVVNGALRGLCLPTDAFGQAVQLDQSLHAPQHVVESSFRHHCGGYSVDAAAACKCPVAYIAAEKPMGDVARMKALMPQLRAAQVLGSGHYAPQEVPEQVNAMIQRFQQLIDTEQHTAA